MRRYSWLAALVGAFALGSALVRYDLFPPQAVIDAKRWLVPAHATLDDRLERPRMFARFPYGSIVMLGDSLTQTGMWSDFYPGVQVSNRGISGDTAINLAARLDRPEYAKPATVFLMIGTNDARLGFSAEQIAASEAEILRKLHAHGSFVYAQSILFTWSEPKNRVIAQVNAALRSECDRIGQCVYIDLNPVLAPHGRLENSEDGTHLTPTGYVKWRDALAPYIAEASRHSASIAGVR